MRFEIPADVLGLPRGYVPLQVFRWELIAAASLPGVSYRSVFDVPVFEREAVERLVAAP